MAIPINEIMKTRLENIIDKHNEELNADSKEQLMTMVSSGDFSYDEAKEIIDFVCNGLTIEESIDAVVIMSDVDHESFDYLIRSAVKLNVPINDDLVKLINECSRLAEQREVLFNAMCEKINISELNQRALFGACLDYRMDPEQIGYLYNNEAGALPYETVRLIATNLLAGLTIEDMNDITKDFSDFPNLNKDDFTEFSEKIEIALKNAHEREIFDDGFLNKESKPYADDLKLRNSKKDPTDVYALLAAEEAKTAPMKGFDLPESSEDIKNDEDVTRTTIGEDDDHDVI